MSHHFISVLLHFSTFFTKTRFFVVADDKETARQVLLNHKHTGDSQKLTVDGISTSANWAKVCFKCFCLYLCLLSEYSVSIISRILKKTFERQPQITRHAGACSTRQNKITAVAHSGVTHCIHHFLAGVLSVCLVPGSKHWRRVSKHSVTIHTLFIMTQKSDNLSDLKPYVALTATHGTICRLAYTKQNST